MKYKIFIFFACALFFLTGFARAGDNGVELRGFVLGNSNATAEIRFGLHFTHPGEIIKALDEGETLELVCKAKLHRIRSFIWDDNIGEGEYTCVLYKEMLKGKYVLECPQGNRVMQNTQGEAFFSRLSRIRIPLCPWEKISGGGKYSVTLEAELKVEGIPDWIRNTLFFWSWDMVEPVYYEMQFDY